MTNLHASHAHLLVIHAKINQLYARHALILYFSLKPSLVFLNVRMVNLGIKFLESARSVILVVEHVSLSRQIAFLAHNITITLQLFLLFAKPAITQSFTMAPVHVLLLVQVVLGVYTAASHAN